MIKFNIDNVDYQIETEKIPLFVKGSIELKK